VWNAIVGQGVKHLIKCELYIWESLRERGAGAEGVELAENLGGVMLAEVIPLVVVTEFLAAKGG